MTREGAHSRSRVLHALGDSTGFEMVRALLERARRTEAIEVRSFACSIDLDRHEGRIVGCRFRDYDGAEAIVRARATLLATGGAGQVFAETTNPPVATGDGVAMAWRAGAALLDMEFVQFHPTALAVPRTGGAASAQQPLVSEALRGEGAYLRDPAGERFMLGQHDLAELAPRDVVAKAIHRVLLEQGTDHVWLDARHVPDVATRFPTITASCRAIGVDPASDLIPVAPAAHYASGGVRTDLRGRTSIPGLYACGEVACTGVHGANRLASNSLLEGLVFARRIAEDIAADLPAQRDPVTVAGQPSGSALAEEVRVPLQRAMTRGAGVLRSAATLTATADALADLGTRRAAPRTATWEAANLLTVSAALVAAAARRAETRGCHWREDFPDASPDWLGHLLAALPADGTLTETWEPNS
jgi:L-aspartate oxidase